MFVAVLVSVLLGVAVASAHFASICEIAWQVEFSTRLTAVTVSVPIPLTR